MQYKITLTEEEFSDCTIFAQNSAKTQREYRSGGSQIRAVQQIEEDTLRGKVGELIVKKFFDNNGILVKLDFNIYPRGKWDEADIKINGYTVAIKTSKYFARWLLLETKDLEREDAIFDYYIFVKVDKDLHGGIVSGYITKDIVLDKKDSNNYWLKKGELIPGTTTPLDAPNYARAEGTLLRGEKEWDSFIVCLSGKPSIA